MSKTSLRVLSIQDRIAPQRNLPVFDSEFTNAAIVSDADVRIGPLGGISIVVLAAKIGNNVLTTIPVLERRS
jgi:hypothetical protein